MSYKVVRFYQNKPKRTIKRGLTLTEAQAHCRDPATSNVNPETLKKGRSWFDGYEEE